MSHLEQLLGITPEQAEKVQRLLEQAHADGLRAGLAEGVVIAGREYDAAEAIRRRIAELYP